MQKLIGNKINLGAFLQIRSDICIENTLKELTKPEKYLKSLFLQTAKRQNKNIKAFLIWENMLRNCEL